MIKINLLPKEIEKRAAAQQKVILIGGAVGFVLLILIGGYFSRVAKLTTLKGRIARVEKELKKLKPVVQKVNEIQKKKEALNNKIEVIKNLMSSRLLYPVFMEKFAAILPTRVWITALNTKTVDNALELKLSVLAGDNYAVADFINILELSEKYHNIEFTGISTVSADDAEVRSFTINCSYYPTGKVPEKVEKKQTPKRKKRKKRRR